VQPGGAVVAGLGCRPCSALTLDAEEVAPVLDRLRALAHERGRLLSVGGEDAKRPAPGREHSEAPVVERQKIGHAVALGQHHD
jgi:hypothetical protein